jgi:hypothetical protein
MQDVRRELERQRGELGPKLEAAGVPPADVAKALSLVRDTIAIEPGTARESAARAGGLPDLPSESDWPRGKIGPLDFVAQIPLEMIAPLDVHARLPSSGLLSFFVKHVVHDETGELELEACVLHLPATAALAPQKIPKGALKTKPRELVFRPRAMLPPYGSRVFQSDRVDGRYKTVYDEHYDMGSTASHHGMLCFDRPFEARLAADDVILLRIDHGGGIPYDFEEAAVVYFVISKPDLAARRWQAVRVMEHGSI